MKLRRLNVNVRKMMLLKGISLGLVTSCLVGCLSGCGKKVECDIKKNHVHEYVNDAGYVRYLDKEYLSYEGYDRKDNFRELNEEDIELYKYMDKNDMLRIDDNIDVILEQMEQNRDYIEYRYEYTYMQPVPHCIITGKVTTTYFTYIPITHYSWTSDVNHSRLTGEHRLCHYVYTAYKIEKDEKGKYALIPSKEVDDIREVMEEYPFIKESYFKGVDVKNGTDLDYEDGPSDLSLEEQEYSDKMLNKTR